MKITKILLATIVAGAVMNIAAIAGDLTLVSVPNGHGQVSYLYRSSAPTIAVFTGSGVGASSGGTLKAVSKDNGHGQSTILYRRVP